MGGGPPSADVVRSSCIVTFPEETLAEPVPVDAWYLHAVGRTFLRRLARDRVGDDMRIALVMQPIDSDEDENDSACDQKQEDEETEMQQQAKLKRYVSVATDEILRTALQETFDHPERVLVLHVISLEKVRDTKSIHVRPEINPNVSPEPVPPMGMVFPTLHVEGVTRVPAATGMGSSLLAMSSSYSMSKSVYVPPVHKGHSSEFEGKALAHSTSFVEEREYTWRGAAADNMQQSNGASQQQRERQDAEKKQPQVVPQPHIVTSDSTETITQAPAAATEGLSVAKQIDDAPDASDIPVARIVGHAEPSPSSSESDYVMLELQTGAGLGETPSSTYFISSMWHVQAEEMSASMRLESSEMAASRRQPETTQQQGDRVLIPVAVSLEESFVMLER